MIDSHTHVGALFFLLFSTFILCVFTLCLLVGVLTAVGKSVSVFFFFLVSLSLPFCATPERFFFFNICFVDVKLHKFKHTHTRIYRHTHRNTPAHRKTNQKQKEEQGEGCYGGSSSLPAPPLPTPPRIPHPSVLIRKKANTSIISELPCNRKGGNSLSLFIYLFIYFAVLVLFFFGYFIVFPVLRTHFPLFFFCF